MLVLSLGCAPEPYIAARAACVGDPPVAYLGMEPVSPSAGCVEAMRGAADWSSLEPDHQVRLEAAIYTVLLSDSGTVGELESSLTAAEAILESEIEDARARWGLDDDAPASRFWYDWFSTSVDEFLEPEVEKDTAGADYLDGQVRIYWSNLSSEQNVVLASGLVHEASHVVTPPHNSDGTDNGPDGSYGVQAHWLDAWWDRQIDRRDLARCWEIRTYVRHLCNDRIVDEGELEPCLDLRERYDCIEGD